MGYKDTRVSWMGGFPLPGSKLYKPDPEKPWYEPPTAWFDPWGVQDVRGKGIEIGQTGANDLHKPSGVSSETAGFAPAQGTGGGNILTNYAPPEVDFTSPDIAREYRNAQEHAIYGPASFGTTAKAYINQDNLYSEILHRREGLPSGSPDYNKLTSMLTEIEDTKIPQIPVGPTQSGHVGADAYLANQEQQQNSAADSIQVPESTASGQDIYNDTLDAANNEIQSASNDPTYDTEQLRLALDMRQFNKYPSVAASHDDEFSRIDGQAPREENLGAIAASNIVNDKRLRGR